jgi:hypothetical protein
MKNNFLGKTMVAIFLGLAMLFSSVGYAAENIDPCGVDDQYAWGENVGWLNFEPSGNGGPGVEVKNATVEGYAWGENIGWINFGPMTYGGVINDGSGSLSGYAWGENVGWINFSPSFGGVCIDALGTFRGSAWAENVGWINFSTAVSPVRTSWVNPTGCEGDFTADGKVLYDDLLIFAADYSRTDCVPANPPCEGDFNCDGKVLYDDLLIFASDYSRTDCPTCP